MLVPTPEMLKQALEIINKFSPIPEGDVVNNLPEGKINFSNGGRLLYSNAHGFRFDFVPFDLVEGKGFVRYFPDEQTNFYCDVVYMINNRFLNKQLSW
jgi:hypothetical protein